MITFAQNFEDVMLERLFQGQSEGFYVDVGAWHPDKYSVTRHFYDKGWRGLNIEPIREQFLLFARDRPRDINVQAAVGRLDGEVVRFYECASDTSLSTTDPAQAAALQSKGRQISEYDVTQRTLQSIIDECCPGLDIDFLKVDVEGGERLVLEGVDWSRTRPKVLVIEATKPATPIIDWDQVDDIANWADWEPMLLEQGYLLAHYDGLSRFYLREDLEHWKQRLTLPPGVFDRLESPLEGELRDRIDQIEADRAERLAIIEKLTEALSESEADRSRRLELIESQARHIEQIEVDRAARLTALEDLSSQIADIEADRANRLAMIELLNERLRAAERLLTERGVVIPWHQE